MAEAEGGEERPGPLGKAGAEGEGGHGQGPLPAGWSEARTGEGAVYYLNHRTRATQWHHPSIPGRLERGETEDAHGLPLGWEELTDAHGDPYFVDHITRISTYVDPRTPPDTQLGGLGGGGAAGPALDLASATARQVVLQADLQGKVALVTGGSSGIGAAVVDALVSRGATVVLACRDLDKGHRVAKAAQGLAGSVHVHQLDLGSLESIRAFVAVLPVRHLHYLVCCAGVFEQPYRLAGDAGGTQTESTFAINYLGHFALMQRLTPLLALGARNHGRHSRAVSVVDNSATRRQPRLDFSRLPLSAAAYSAAEAYAQSKRCLALVSHEFHRRYSQFGLTFSTVHPGDMVSTDLNRSSWSYFLIYALANPFIASAEQGAASVVYACVSKALEGLGGQHIEGCRAVAGDVPAAELEDARRLWDFSIDLTGIVVDTDADAPRRPEPEEE